MGIVVSYSPYTGYASAAPYTPFHKKPLLGTTLLMSGTEPPQKSAGLANSSPPTTTEMNQRKPVMSPAAGSWILPMPLASNSNWDSSSRWPSPDTLNERVPMSPPRWSSFLRAKGDSLPAGPTPPSHREASVII